MNNIKGWMIDPCDARDYTTDHYKINNLILKTSAWIPNLPSSCDNSPSCTTVKNQLQLGSCTAFAGCSLIENLIKKAHKKDFDASELFLYKLTRSLLQWSGDTGAYLRAMMGALAFFGVPPEKYYPYAIEAFEKEPESFVYQLAQSFQPIRYYRLDTPDRTPDQILQIMKQHLKSGITMVFGFNCYESLQSDFTNRTGCIQYPEPTEAIIGGHAMHIVGYDDNMALKSKNKGVLKFKNSWGTQWGYNGYGYLPYDYILNGLAVDVWTALSQEFIDTNQFIDLSK